jgi:hypothetical protein
MGRGRGGVTFDVELYVRDHPHPASPIEGEELWSCGPPALLAMTAGGE